MLCALAHIDGSSSKKQPRRGMFTYTGLSTLLELAVKLCVPIVQLVFGQTGTACLCSKQKDRRNFPGSSRFS
ncbi:hypothetical protein M378DRAFT_160060, partial [Amanita muscaria Koide BX008]